MRLISLSPSISLCWLQVVPNDGPLYFGRDPYKRGLPAFFLDLSIYDTALSEQNVASLFMRSKRAASIATPSVQDVMVENLLDTEEARRASSQSIAEASVGSVSGRGAEWLVHPSRSELARTPTPLSAAYVFRRSQGLKQSEDLGARTSMLEGIKGGIDLVSQWKVWPSEGGTAGLTDSEASNMLYTVDADKGALYEEGVELFKHGKAHFLFFFAPYFGSSFVMILKRQACWRTALLASRV